MKIPLLYAHRGACDRAPENTLAAFQEAARLGADGIELDVRASRDGHVVVAHDTHFGRVGERAAWVALLPLSEIRRVRLDPNGAHRPPTLHEALDLAAAENLLVNLEVKTEGPGRKNTLRSVLRTLRSRHARELEAIVLSSFDARSLVWLRLRLRRLRVALLMPPRPTRRRHAMLKILQDVGVHPFYGDVSRESVRKHQRKGRLVNVWTVNHRKVALRLAAFGVDGIITDDVPQLRRALAQAAGTSV